MIADSLMLLFGKSAEFYTPMLNSVVADVSCVKYEFMEEKTYMDLLQNDPLAANQIYWREMLFRAHWAAGSSLLRNKRWLDACHGAYLHNNYLGFAACLRGLVESAADTKCTLQHIPRVLAENFYLVNRVLLGKTRKLLISQDVEDLLLHFQFARKLKKGESAPDSHEALHMAKYIESVTQTNSEVKTLYAELCNLAHPIPAITTLMTRIYSLKRAVSQTDSTLKQNRFQKIENWN